MEKVNIAEKLALNDDYYVPRIVGELKKSRNESVV